VHLTVTRLDERRYETLIRRRDGVRLRVSGVGHMFAIPHDLAHLAIEGALGLRRGFWGSVAAGAVFESMSHLGGRRKPRAAARSNDLLKVNRGHLTEAEVLVRIFNDALEKGHGPSPRYSGGAWRSTSGLRPGADRTVLPDRRSMQRVRPGSGCSPYGSSCPSAGR
jgi:hypothetical protein